MEKIVYVYWHTYEWQAVEEGRLEVFFCRREFALEDYTFLGEFAITVPEFKVPTQVIVNLNRVKYIKAKRAEYLAKAFLYIKEVDGEVKNLLTLPDKV